jgi:hypothetical protein
MKSRKSWLLTMGIMVLLVILVSIPVFGQTEQSNRLRYGQVANGVSGSSTYVSTLVVSNPQDRTVEVKLEDFDHNNPNNALRTQYFTDCTISFNGTISLNFLIPPFSSCKLETDGVGALETGWLRVTEVTGSYSLGGYLAWTYYLGNQTTGIPVFTIGVSPMEAYNQISIPVLRDNSSNEDTGYSLVNPYTSPVSVRARLFNKSGVEVSFVDITLQGWGHRAQFLSELFPVTLGPANQFVGNLVITGWTNTDGVLASVLIARRGQFGGATASMSSSFKLTKRANDREEDNPTALRGSNNGVGKWNSLLSPSN